YSMDISESEYLNDSLNHHTGETTHQNDASSDNESEFEYSSVESSTSFYQDDNVSFDSDAHFEDDASSNELNFDDLSQPLYSSSSITNSEAFISILAFIIRFNLSQTYVQELLNLLQLLLPPNNFPNTRYLFFKLISSVFDNTCEVHLYCKECNYYVSEFLAQNKPNVCPSCEEVPFNAEESIRNGNFFMYMPLKPQIKIKLEKENLNEANEYRKKNSNGLGENYRDVMDGDLYRSIPAVNNFDNLSLQFNVDGIPIYRKSRYSIWPIQCVFNELPPVKRKHIMMCGLWFGKEKPDINFNYFIPFVNELDSLIKSGINWFDKHENKNKSTNIIPLICSSDAPARAMIQNFTQYNGAYGCGFCEQKGEVVEKGRGTCRIYDVVKGSLPQLRSHDQTVEDASVATEKSNPFKGVKGPSLLMKLYPHFDLINGFIPDFMHAVLLGVTRQIVNIWIETSKLTCSLNGKSVKKLNERIHQLKVPSETVRCLRSTKDISFWKASEWRIFFYVSPIILMDILEVKAYKNWLCFVHCISLLLSNSVSSKDVSDAERSLKKFITGVKEIYGVQELSYNMHLLLHMPKAVSSWGPLWAHSCFIFENSLGKLKTFHHGTKGVPTQILSTCLYKSILKTAVLSLEKVSHSNVKNFINNMVIV
ncbi:hypothetical protein AVEN_110229-1, partial [Araneus ventricosus]